jgi:nitrate/nitrite transporter NarK
MSNSTDSLRANFQNSSPEILDPLHQTTQKQTFRSSNARYWALALICAVNFGPFFCFDNPQALESTIKEVLNLDDSGFDWFYSVYSLPNIILPLFGGLIIDRLSLRLSLVLFSALPVLGQAIVTIGAMKTNYAIMLVGRVVFGLGGECIKISQSAMAAKWFGKKDLAFAMGSFLCVARIGSSLNSFLSPKIYIWADSFSAPFLVGFILTIFSLVGTITLVVLDKKADKIDNTESQQKKKDKVTFADVKKFSLLFYHLLLNNLAFYGAFFGLNNNLNNIWSSRFGYTPSDAGNYIAIVYLISAFTTPLLGMYLDKNGKRVACIIFASCTFIVDNLIIAFIPTAAEGTTNYYMIAPLLGVAVFYSIYAAVFWPCIPLVVEQKAIGIAFGIATATLNLMLFVNPIIVGVINDKTINIEFGYFWSEIYLSGLVAIGFFITLWMFYEDMRTGERLHKASPQRKMIQIAQEDDKSMTSLPLKGIPGKSMVGTEL